MMSMQGRLLLIDGAPEQLKALVQQIPYVTIDELQIKTLSNIMNTVNVSVNEKVFFEMGRIICNVRLFNEIK